MNREQKLALVVGFSLVLLLSVLISDHFSPARHVRPAEEIQPVSSREIGATVPGLSPAGSSVIPVSNPGINVPGSGSGDIGSARKELMPLPGKGGGAATGVAGAGMGPGTPVALGPSKQLEFEVKPDPAQVSVREVPGAIKDKTTITDRSGPDPLGQSSGNKPGDTIVMGGSRDNRGGGQAGQSGSAQGGQAVPAGIDPNVKLTRHDVKEGESPYSIAKQYYGTGGVWEKLKAYNPGKISDNGNVRAGVTLMLPPKDVILGRATSSTTAGANQTGANQAGVNQAGGGQTGGNQPAGSGAQASGPAGKSESVEYVVRDGDSLASIARKALGNAKRWKEIADANKDTLKDPESLTVGMKLKVPAR